MSEPITRVLREEGDGQRVGRGGGKKTMTLEMGLKGKKGWNRKHIHGKTL